jgi:hypothetical protein
MQRVDLISRSANAAASAVFPVGWQHRDRV